jgi:hypothetical protein
LRKFGIGLDIMWLSEFSGRPSGAIFYVRMVLSWGCWGAAA